MIRGQAGDNINGGVFMSGDDGTRFISQIQPQPDDRGTGFKELKNAVKKKADAGYQFNPLGGPLDHHFKTG